jgi:hypothetical protein
VSDEDPEVGWAQPWPRDTGEDPAWDVFVRSLDPEQVATERYRVHGDLDEERFGSARSIADNHAHAFMAAEFWRAIHDTYTQSERREREQRYAAQAEADANRLIAERDARARQRDRLAAARAQHEREVAELDEADVLAAMTRHNRSTPRNGHAA